MYPDAVLKIYGILSVSFCNYMHFMTFCGKCRRQIVGISADSSKIVRRIFPAQIADFKRRFFSFHNGKRTKRVFFLCRQGTCPVRFHSPCQTVPASLVHFLQIDIQLFFCHFFIDKMIFSPVPYFLCPCFQYGFYFFQIFFPVVFNGKIIPVFYCRIWMKYYFFFIPDIALHIFMMYSRMIQGPDAVSKIHDPHTYVHLIQIVFKFLIKTADFLQACFSKTAVCSLQIQKFFRLRHTVTRERRSDAKIRISVPVAGGILILQLHSGIIIDKSSDSADLRAGIPCDKIRDPVRICNPVIVNKSDDLPGCGFDTDISGYRQIPHRTGQQLDMFSIFRYHFFCLIGRRTIYDNYLKIFIHLMKQALQRNLQTLCSVMRIDYHTHI